MKLIWFLIFFVIVGCNNSLIKKDKERVIISKKVINDSYKLNLKYRDSLIIPKDIKIFSRNLESTSGIPKDTVTKHKSYIKYPKKTFILSQIPYLVSVVIVAFSIPFFV